ncbi:alkaline phosphatase family protein [Sphingomonas sp. MMS24-JH45]
MLDSVVALGQPANVVIVSDHGMAAMLSERVVPLDRIVAPADARLVETGPYATFLPTPGAVAAALLLQPHPYTTCWRKEAIPARFAYGRNPAHPAVPVPCGNGLAAQQIGAGEALHGRQPRL